MSTLHTPRYSYRTKRAFSHTLCTTAAHGARQKHGRFIQLFLLQQFSGTGLHSDAHPIETAALPRIAKIEIDFRVFPHYYTNNKEKGRVKQGE
jgi:hypothetical protein